MAEEKSTILIDVQIDASKVAEEVGVATKKLQTLIAIQKDLDAQFKEGSISSSEYGKQMASTKKQIEETSRAIKSKTAILQAAEVTEVSNTQSLDEQRQVLNTLQKAYANLAGSEKEAADAQGGLRDKIDQLSESVKAQEKAIGDNRRNVGNYPKELTAIVPGLDTVIAKMDKFKNVTEQMGNVTPVAFKNMASGIGTATKAALKFIATPIGAIIAAIVVALKLLKAGWDKLTESINKNDDAGTAIARLYAVTIQPIINVVTKAFDNLAIVIGKVAGKMADLLGGSRDGAKAAENLVVSVDNLQEAERQYVRDSADRNKQIAELRNKAEQRDKYSVEERKKFLQDALDLEKANLEDRKRNAAEEYRILEETAKQNADTSDETKNKIAQAYAAMVQAETDYFNKTKEINTKLVEFDRQAADEAKKRAEEVKKSFEKQAKAEYDAYKLRIEGIEALNNVEKANADERNKRQDEERAALQAIEEAERQYEEKRAQALIDAGLQVQSDYDKELLGLIELRAQELLTEDEYEQAKDILRQKYADKESERQKKLNAERAAEWSNSLGALSSSLQQASDAFGAYADQSEEAKRAQKAFAIGAIVAAQGQSIAQGALALSSGIASASALPFPSNIPAILSVVATITSLIAGVAGSIVQAKQVLNEDAGNFSNGGVVGGTSRRGDRLIAHVNSDEVILNPKQASNTLYQIANGVGGLGGAYDGMYNAMSAALREMPSPIMDYTEFKSFGQKVSQYKEIARI